MAASTPPASKAKTELIERFLDYLIDPNQCIDTFGRTYIDDLEHIVVENHEFDFTTQKFSDDAAQEWFDRIRSECGFPNLEELIAYVRAHRNSLDIANIRPRSTFHGETMFASEPAYQRLKDNSTSVDFSNEFQRNMSMHGVTELPQLDTSADLFESFMRSDRVNPWTYAIRREIARGTLARDDQVVCIGNRWIGEILYFRQTLGLVKTVGVDLISNNPELVIAADMHHLPFKDESIKMVFTRGTINKSYDVRLFAKELVRVLKQDGLLAIETPGPFGYGVTRLGLTDVKSWNNVLRLFHRKIGRIIYRDAMEPYAYQAAAKKLLRIFIQLDKDAGHRPPKVEPFPELRFKIHDFCRGYVLRLRHTLRRARLWAKRKMA
jgi:SAM-dependent methyltransferase